MHSNSGLGILQIYKRQIYPNDKGNKIYLSVCVYRKTASLFISPLMSLASKHKQLGAGGLVY